MNDTKNEPSAPETTLISDIEKALTEPLSLNKKAIARAQAFFDFFASSRPKHRQKPIRSLGVISTLLNSIDMARRAAALSFNLRSLRGQAYDKSNGSEPLQAIYQVADVERWKMFRQAFHGTVFTPFMIRRVNAAIAKMPNALQEEYRNNASQLTICAYPAVGDKTRAALISEFVGRQMPAKVAPVAVPVTTPVVNVSPKIVVEPTTITSPKPLAAKVATVAPQVATARPGFWSRALSTTKEVVTEVRSEGSRLRAFFGRATRAIGAALLPAKPAVKTPVNTKPARERLEPLFAEETTVATNSGAENSKTAAERKRLESAALLKTVMAKYRPQLTQFNPPAVENKDAVKPADTRAAATSSTNGVRVTICSATQFGSTPLALAGSQAPIMSNMAMPLDLGNGLNADEAELVAGK